MKNGKPAASGSKLTEAVLLRWRLGERAAKPATPSKPTAELAAEQTDRATTVAENVMEAVAEEARKEGLTVEGAKSAVGGISAKVGRVVDAAGKGISEWVTSTKSS
jgi:hypothetical protein